ncbi:hypothetical protein FQS32_17270 [Salmonella enterica subsp. enterica]|nr:hypothetical protein [Salmonella enterica subsp. enterica serovar Brandenburg]ECK0376524.1 hypothetical protein [Salmonella enterica subsp. enterica serovar Brandenburg]ECK0532192.1 hypothetical protein [Salmonella enterica subsp. enterica serovar Brandenburg]
MTAKTEPENDGKTADNAFEINCDRVKVTEFTLPLHQPRPGYSRGTAFAAGRTGHNSLRSRNNVRKSIKAEPATSLSFVPDSGGRRPLLFATLAVLLTGHCGQD